MYKEEFTRYQRSGVKIMNTAKKCFAILMVIVMAFSCFVFTPSTAFAEETGSKALSVITDENEGGQWGGPGPEDDPYPDGPGPGDDPVPGGPGLEDPEENPEEDMAFSGNEDGEVTDTSVGDAVEDDEPELSGVTAMAAGVVIDLGNLGTASAKSTKSGMGWTYVYSPNSENGSTLTLSDKGPYELTGTSINNNLSVIVSGKNAEVTLNGASVTAPIAAGRALDALVIKGANVTVKLVGDSVLRGGRSMAGIKIGNGLSATITSSAGGKVTAVDYTAWNGCGIYLGKNATLNINGSATVDTYRNDTYFGDIGLYAAGGNTVNIAKNATLKLEGTIDGLRSDGDISLASSGKMSSNGESGYGIDANGTIKFSGATTFEVNSGGQQIRTPKTAKMNNNTIIKLGGAGEGVCNFEKSQTAKTHKWKVTNGDIGDPNLTDNVLFVFVDTGAGPVTVELVPVASEPEIFGPGTKTLKTGYAATTVAFTIAGSPSPSVSVSHNEAGSKVKWNNSAKKLEIAKGVPIGSYTIILDAKNSKGVKAYKFTLRVVAKTVTGLKAVLAGPNDVMLSWDHVAGAAMYEVERAESASGPFRVFTYIGGSPSVRQEGCIDYIGLKTGQTYYYRVRAVAKPSEADQLGGGYSNVVSMKPVPGKVGDVTVTPLSTKSLVVKWSSLWGGVAGVSGYEVWRATSKTGTYKKVDTTTTYSYTDANLKTGGAYFYKIRGFITTTDHGNVYGAYSAIIKGVPAPTQATELSAGSAGYNSVKVEWDQVANASGYEIHRATAVNGKYTKAGSVSKGSTLSFTGKGLTTGKGYWFKVRAYITVSGKKVYGAFSAPINATPFLGNLTGFAAGSAGHDSIKVSWKKLAGASGYEVYRAATSGGQYTKIKSITNGNTVSFTHKGLPAGTEYYYKVVPYRNVSGKKHYSQGHTAPNAIDAGLALSALASPLAPTGAKAVKAGADAVQLSWKKVVGASGYEVYRGTSSPGVFTFHATAHGTGALSHTDGNLPAGSVYYYKVRAYTSTPDGNVHGAFGPVITAAPSPSKPAAVGDAKAASAGYDSVKVSWGKSSGASGYEVWRSESSGGAYAKVKDVTSPSTLSFTDTSLTTGKAYYYKVRAYVPNNTGALLYGGYSAVVNAKPQPAAVGGAKAEAVDNSSIKLSWNQVAGASGYEVYRSDQSDGEYKKTDAVPGGTLTYTNTGLSATKTYYYKVRAYTAVSGSNVFGAYSSVVNAKPNSSTSPSSVKIAIAAGSAFGPFIDYDVYMVVGRTCPLEAKITPSTANANTEVTWSSNSPAIATVDPSGIIRGVAPGSATITAKTANGKTNSIKVRVDEACTDFTFAKNSYDVKKGQVTPVYLSVSPDLGFKSFEVRSSNNYYATADYDPVTNTVRVTGHNTGTPSAPATAIITVKYFDTTLEDFFIVNVVEPTASVKVGGGLVNHTMTNGDSWTVPVDFVPAGSSADYTLRSTNTSVLRIDGNKTAVAVGAGTAYIEAVVGGRVSSDLYVSVSPRKDLKPSIAYVSTKYPGGESLAILVMQITLPVPDATYYVFAEHDSAVNAALGVNPKANRTWMVPANKASNPVELGPTTDFTGHWQTGLRYVSCTAFYGPTSNYSRTNPYNGDKISHTGNEVVVLYHPLYVGGFDNGNKNGPVTDGYLYSTQFMMYMPYTGNMEYVYIPPYGMNFTFNHIPYANGYEYLIAGPVETSEGIKIVETRNTIFTPDPYNNNNPRLNIFLDYMFTYGVTTVYIQPFVISGGKRLYGDMRTIEFNVKTTNWNNGKFVFWEDESTLGVPKLRHNIGK